MISHNEAESGRLPAQSHHPLSIQIMITMIMTTTLIMIINFIVNLIIFCSAHGSKVPPQVKIGPRDLSLACRCFVPTIRISVSVM